MNPAPAQKNLAEQISEQGTLGGTALSGFLCSFFIKIMFGT